MTSKRKAAKMLKNKVSWVIPYSRCEVKIVLDCRKEHAKVSKDLEGCCIKVPLLLHIRLRRTERPSAWTEQSWTAFSRCWFQLVPRKVSGRNVSTDLSIHATKVVSRWGKRTPKQLLAGLKPGFEHLCIFACNFGHIFLTTREKGWMQNPGLVLYCNVYCT